MFWIHYKAEIFLWTVNKKRERWREVPFSLCFTYRCPNLKGEKKTTPWPCMLPFVAPLWRGLCEVIQFVGGLHIDKEQLAEASNAEFVSKFQKDPQSSCFDITLCCVLTSHIFWLVLMLWLHIAGVEDYTTLFEGHHLWGQWLRILVCKSQGETSPEMAMEDESGPCLVLHPFVPQCPTSWLRNQKSQRWLWVTSSHCWPQTKRAQSCRKGCPCDASRRVTTAMTTSYGFIAQHHCLGGFSNAGQRRFSKALWSSDLTRSSIKLCQFNQQLQFFREIKPSGQAFRVAFCALLHVILLFCMFYMDYYGLLIFFTIL